MKCSDVHAQLDIKLFSVYYSLLSEVSFQPMLYYGVDVSAAVECILSKAVSTSLCYGTVGMCIYVHIYSEY